MEAPSISGASSSTTLTPVRLPGPAIAPAVKTELPESKTVTAIGAEPAVKLDISDRAQQISDAREAMQRFVTKHVTFDDDLRQVVITSVDQETGKTISQMPDEMSIKLRLYMRDALEKMDKAAAGGQTQRVEAIA